MERDIIHDWNAMDAVWKHMVKEKLGAEQMDDYPILLTEIPGNSNRTREKLLMHFMEEYRVPKFYLMNTALANFYFSGKTSNDSSVIIDCGYGTTNISCVYMGMYLSKCSSTIPIAGRDITEHLSQLMAHSSMYFHLDVSSTIAKSVKEKHCSIARDIQYANSGMCSYLLPDGRSLKIADERFKCAEILFNPTHVKRKKRKKGGRYKLDQNVIACINSIDDDDLEKEMYANIYCCGGTANMNNFCYRLQTQMQNSLVRRISIASPKDIQKTIKVRLVSQPSLSAWFGSQMIIGANDGMLFYEKWITSEDYHEYGCNILQRKCTHQDL